MLTRSQTKDGATLFDRAVHVIHGDIGYLREIDDKALDALAFPTHSHLSNNGIGAAAAVHRRAGPQLDAYLRSPMAGNVASRGLATGEVVVTPAFNANVAKLIHCVGPRVTNPECERLLERTYESLMSAVAHDGLKCVAVASISTGNLGVPAADGARVAMSVLQRFVRTRQGWNGAIAFVCFERDVFDAFVVEKRRVLQQYDHCCGCHQPLVGTVYRAACCCCAVEANHSGESSRFVFGQPSYPQTYSGVNW